MRKSVVTVIAILAVMTFAFSAHAQKRAVKGFGHGYGGCCFYYDGEGWGQNQFTPITQDEAKARLDAYIKDNFKGYTVKDIKGVETPRGIAHIAEVNDVSGNVFKFFIGCNGIVRGPIHKGNFRN